MGERRIKRSAEHLARLTGAKYSKCYNYVKDLSTDHHVHIFHIYGVPHTIDRETIYRLRCALCGETSFAFPVKRQTISVGKWTNTTNIRRYNGH